LSVFFNKMIPIFIELMRQDSLGWYRFDNKNFWEVTWSAKYN